MKSSLPIKPIVVIAVSYFTALLFIYAATSKLLDFENFQLQLGQSPLLSAFAQLVALLVPICEYGIALLLFLPKFRIIGLLLSTALMTMFTVYIYIVLNYSSFVPCSCGGVLENMTWDEHLLFNVVILAFNVLAVLLPPLKNQPFKSMPL